MHYYHNISKALTKKIDLARALAALIVMLVHLRGGFFVKYNDLLPEYQNEFNFLLFFITRIGHECVMVFFVLSGFLVGGNFLSDFLSGKQNLKKYLLSRIVRMWIVLIPALILGYILSIIYFYISKNAYYLKSIDVATFIGNLLFLQDLFVLSFANNDPLWSLTNEFWYYILWPLGLYLFFLQKKHLVKLLLFILLIFVLSLIAPKIMLLSILWIIGAIIRFIPKNNILEKSILYYLSLVLFFVSIVYSNIYKTYLGEFLTGITFSIILVFWMYRKKEISNTIYKPSKFLAEFSFSLYAIHYILLFGVLQFISKLFSLNIRINHATLTDWLIYLFSASILVFISYLFYLITEKHTYRLRSKLILVLSKKKGTNSFHK